MLKRHAAKHRQGVSSVFVSAQTKPVRYLFRLHSGSQIKPNLTLLHTLLGVQSECSYTSANVIFPTGVKRPGREADHTSSLVLRLRISGATSLRPLHPYAFTACTGQLYPLWISHLKYFWICSTVLLKKLTVPQLVKKFPAFSGTRRFITALTSARHLSLSWASSIQSICPHPTSWRSNLILSSHLRLGLPSCN